MDIHQFEPLWNAWYIRNLIGSGSYGVVYRAEKTIKGHTFECAIKYISIPKDEAELLNLENDLHFTDSSDINQYLEEYAQKTLNEYISLQQFDAFPNFVHVQDILMQEKKDMPGYDMFIRMEKLNSIKELFKSDSVNEQEVIRLGIDICTALVEMHKRNLVHRDIKPQNILVSDDGIYKLADFGSVHKLSGTSSAMSMKGTFDYTAPEVLQGSPADSRVDIYSLGIVMYQLLNQQVSLSIRVPGDKLTLPQNVSRGLADIVLKACEYYPDKRWKTAEEMLDALTKLKQEESSPHNYIGNKGKNSNAKKRAWISAIVVCVVLLAALSVYLSGIFKKQSTSPYISPEKEQSSSAELYESAQQTTDSKKETESTVAKQTIDVFYTITWQDDAGNIIDTDEYAYGTVPEHSEPIKKADAQYSYTFSGWSPAVEKVTGNAVYKATYSPVTNNYTVIWLDDNGRVIDTAEYAYGTVPEHSDPIKEADAQYTYSFSGWTPDVGKVTGNAVYKATYSPVANKYTITWQDDTGNVIDTAEYAYGAVPEHSEPIKKADAQYSYTFSGWTPAVEKVTGDTVYKATFAPVTYYYTITWQDDTGNVIDTTEYVYGAVPKPSDPIKEADAQYSYIFSGWSPSIEKVTADAIYKATYNPVINKYTITWQDDAGNVIDTAEYAYGAVPEHSEPTKKSDAQYSYTFSGWTPSVEKVTADTIYKATYSPVINKYTITWQDDTGNVIDTAEYAYGAVPEHSDPIKKADEQYSYTFIGWSPAVEKVTGNAVYKAAYNKEVIPTPTQAAVRTITQGTMISFGEYTQSSPLSGRDAVVWIVLDVKDDKALLLSERVLDCKRLNELGKDVSWETCTLRQWLNSSFLNEVFTDEEKNKILEVEIRNASGNYTKDKVFLLSVDEAKEYLGSEASASPTIYAEQKGVKVDFKYDNRCRYWLRTGRFDSLETSYFAYVSYSGYIDDLGIKVQSDKMGVRPAMWVNMAIFQP